MRMHRTRGSEGFTIVETLIVMGVAGLILTITLWAIPTLQRSSRNNQRKQDVQTILSAVSQYELNNSGNMPSAAQPLKLPRLTYYQSPTVKYITMPGACAPGSGTSITVCSAGNWTDAPSNISNVLGSLDNVIVINHEKCDSTSPGHATRQGAGFSDAVALYVMETAGGTNLQCQQL